jgi:tetratricopeptide (TPR) repeat protein
MPDARVAELLQRGLQHHKAGHLADAESCYRQILAIQPCEAAALHLLGLVAHQAGRHDAAAELIRRAIRQDGTKARYISDLGAVLKEQGRLDEAVAAFREALAINPNFAAAHCNLGGALRDQGKLDDAAAACREAIRIRPDYAEAHANLGVLLCDQGRFQEAGGALTQAVRLRPNSAESHFNLGHALRAQGKRAEAVAAYRQAVRLKPNWAEAHASLGALLCEQSEFDAAVSACQQAIRIRPDYAEAHFNLGLVLCAQGKPDQAVLAHHEAIRIKPGYAEAHSALGTALRTQDQLEDAVTAHRHAIHLKPDFADAHANLGRALLDQNKIAEAVDALRQAIVLDPNSAETHHSLGSALRVLGHLSESRTAMEQAVQLAPREVRYLRSLSEIARFVPGDARLPALETLARDTAALSVNDRIELHFALGKAYEDLGQHAAAFAQWREGNALKRKQFIYDEAAMLAGFDRIGAVFTPELFSRWQNVGHPSTAPIFVVGMMRSGTTLIEQILASHPQVFGGGEMHHFAAAVKGIRAAQGEPSADPLELVPRMTEADFYDLGARYLAEIEQIAPGGMHVTDKMPGNFVFAGLIHLALPNAVIIHTIRDPVDTCLSCFSKLFSAEQKHTYDLGELGRYYRRYRMLMAHWRDVLPAGRILDVRYEDVVSDLERQARRIVAHCGLDWDPRCLAFHNTERTVRTASATQVRQPIYKDSVGRWRAHEHFLDPLLAELENAGHVDSTRASIP